jgi:hypothetical protein
MDHKQRGGLSEVTPEELNDLFEKTDVFKRMQENQLYTMEDSSVLHQKIDVLMEIICLQAEHISKSETEHISNINKIQLLCANHINRNKDPDLIYLCDNIVKKIFKFPIYWDKDRYKKVPACFECKNNPRTIMLLPCRHVCYCHDCYYHDDSNIQDIKECPICNTSITNHERISWRFEQIQVDQKTHNLKSPRYIMDYSYWNKK